MPLHFASLFRDAAAWPQSLEAVTILLQGAANPVMHYTGMAAVTFTGSATEPDLSRAVSISVVAVEAITIVPVTAIAVALVTSLVDRLRAQRAQVDDLFQRLIETPEAERGRVARELYDEVGSVLTGLKLMFETTMRRSRDAPDSALREALAILSDLIKQWWGRAPRLASELRSYGGPVTLRITERNAAAVNGLKKKTTAPASNPRCRASSSPDPDTMTIDVSRWHSNRLSRRATS